MGRLDDAEGIVEGGGLLGGLTAWHFRLLVENPWNGGGGYSVREVADWTLDQIWFRLCERDLLKGGRGERVEHREAADVPVAEDGTVLGVAEDGTAIRGRIVGKSLARRLMEEEEERKRKEELWRAKKSRRRGRKGGG